MEKLRGAVFGAGNMGRHHVRIMSAHPNIEFVGIVDPDIERAQKIADLYDTRVFDTIESLPHIDVAIIATPTQYHADIALKLISKGVHLLIEKPLAETPEIGKGIVEAANKENIKIAVGHVERFNPAINTLAKIINKPKMISIERLSPYTPRIKDSVIYDLTVHDIDLACWLADGNPAEVSASGISVYSDTIDAASSVIKFDNGCIATLQTSRITQDKVRKISITDEDSYIIVNTIRQDIEIKRQAEVSFTTVKGDIAFSQSSVVEIPTFDRGGEPLQREQDDFYDAVLNNRKPTVSGEDGLRAIELVDQIEVLCRQ